MTPTACTHGAVMRNLCFQCSMYDIIDERDALRERVQRLEAEYESFKTLFRGKDTYCETCVSLRERVQRLEKALKEIADDPHCVSPTSGEYGVGIQDGHRCAATKAKAALSIPEGEK